MRPLPYQTESGGYDTESVLAFCYDTLVGGYWVTPLGYVNGQVEEEER